MALITHHQQICHLMNAYSSLSGLSGNLYIRAQAGVGVTQAYAMRFMRCSMFIQIL